MQQTWFSDDSFGDKLVKVQGPIGRGPGIGGMMRPTNRPKSGAELFLVQCWVVWLSKKWGTAGAGQKHLCNFGGQIALSYCVLFALMCVYNTCFVFLCVWCRKHVLPCFTQEFNTSQNYRSKHTTSPETSIKHTCCSVLVLLVHCFKEKRRSLFLTVHLTTGRIKTMVCQSWNIWRTFQSA